MVLIWHSVNTGYYGRASMSKCHRYSICQLIILSLTSHSAVHVHKMPTWAVAIAATPSFSSNLASILVKAKLHNLPSSFFLSLASAFSRCSSIEKHIPGLVSLHVGSYSNRSQYFCPWVSCVTCPFNYFPLLTSLTASVRPPQQSGFCADPKYYIIHEYCKLILRHVWRFEARF